MIGDEFTISGQTPDRPAQVAESTSTLLDRILNTRDDAAVVLLRLLVGLVVFFPEGLQKFL